jgi:hypothetical protein
MQASHPRGLHQRLNSSVALSVCVCVWMFVRIQGFTRIHQLNSRELLSLYVADVSTDAYLVMCVYMQTGILFMQTDILSTHHGVVCDASIENFQ